MIDEKKINSNKAVLVGLISKNQSQEKLEEYLDELEFLSHTAGIEPVKRFTQRLDSPNPKLFLGTGKIEEISNYIKDNDIGIVIFDDELSAAQFKNLEKTFDRKVLDRTDLILEIFAQRAQTSYSKTQVDLARYEYILPRLTGLWTHLERQRGGTGTRGGAGEKEIETDRRIVRDKIALLKEKLKEIDKQMETQRKNRGKLTCVSLVGYTNVGKSTIMNLISKTNVLAEDKLFATLDTKVKKVIIENIPFLLSDTVGFIRKLPTGLVESFKSTLDEVKDADIIIHVVDISHKCFEDHIKAVNTILEEIKANDKTTLLVFNKTDNYKYIQKSEDDLTEKKKENYSLLDIKQYIMEKYPEKKIFISAIEKNNIEEFKKILYKLVYKVHVERFPYNDFLYNIPEDLD